MNCEHCGCLLPKRYAPNCSQCGAPRRYVVRDLPLREVTKGTKPPPKPLPPLRPLEETDKGLRPRPKRLPSPDPGQPIDGDDSLIYTYDWGWKIADAIIIVGLVLCVALPVVAILLTLF